VASRTLPPCFAADFDVADLDVADFDPDDLDAAGFEPADPDDFELDERDDPEFLDDLDRLAGVLFLDDPQLDMAVPPYQPWTRQGRYPRRDTGPITPARWSAGAVCR